MVNIPYIIESSGFTYLKGGRTGKSKELHFTSTAGQTWAEPQLPIFLSHLSEPQAPIFLSHPHPHSSTRPVMAEGRASPCSSSQSPPFTRSLLLTCRQVSSLFSKAGNISWWNPITLSPCSREMSKCLWQHTTASSNCPRIFRVFPRLPLALASPIRSPMVLQDEGVEEFRDFYSPAAGGRFKLQLPSTDIWLESFHRLPQF